MLFEQSAIHIEKYLEYRVLDLYGLLKQILHRVCILNFHLFAIKSIFITVGLMLALAVYCRNEFTHILIALLTFRMLLKIVFVISSYEGKAKSNFLF